MAVVEAGNHVSRCSPRFKRREEGNAERRDPHLRPPMPSQLRSSPCRQHAGQSASFCPPFGVGLVLLLSKPLAAKPLPCMAIRQMAGQWRNAGQATPLASAAQQVRPSSMAPHRCLLQVPASQWPTGGLRKRAPASPGSVEGEGGQLPAYRLVEVVACFPWACWPETGDGTGGSLRLELGGEETASRAQALFRSLRLDPDRPERLLTCGGGANEPGSRSRWDAVFSLAANTSCILWSFQRPAGSQPTLNSKEMCAVSMPTCCVSVEPPAPRRRFRCGGWSGS